MLGSLLCSVAPGLGWLVAFRMLQAVMGSVLTANLHGPLPSGFVAATRPGWWIIAACGFAVIVLALITTGRRGRASAAKTATLVATAEEAAQKVPAALADASHTA